MTRARAAGGIRLHPPRARRSTAFRSGAAPAGQLGAARQCSALRSRFVFVALLFAALVSGPGPGLAKEAALGGSLRLRALHSFDSGDNPEVTFGFLDTDARVTSLTEGGLELRLDATFLWDVTSADERRYGVTESFDQVRLLYARQPVLDGRLVLTAGRQLLWDAGNAWIDGATAEWRFADERAGLGLFGGLAPDPYDAAVDADAQTTGLFAVYTEDTLDAALAYAATLRGGALDRHFVYQRTHYRVAPGLYLSDYLVFDLARQAEVTTLLASVDYTPVPPVNLTLNLSRYSIEQYRDAQVYHNVLDAHQALLLGDEVVDLVYNRARLSASVRFWDHVYHYQVVEAKHRSQDDREAYTYTIGLRDEDIADTELRADLSLQLHNGYASDSELVSLVLDRDFGAQFSADLRATYFDGRTIGRATERGRHFDEAQEIWLIGGGLTWRPGRHHQVEAAYDGIYEAELQDLRNQENLFIHTVMARYVYAF